MLNRQYAHPQVVPGSDHTPLDSSSNSSQLWPLPILPRTSCTPPIHIQTSPTATEARQLQWRQEFLEEEFPEEPLEGTWENPIIIKWTSFENWFNESIGLVGGVMLWFSSLHSPFIHLIHVLFTYAILLLDTCLVLHHIYAAFPFPLTLVSYMCSISPSYQFHLFTQLPISNYINYCSSVSLSSLFV